MPQKTTEKMSVHERLSMKKERCGIKCPFLQEEKITIHEAQMRLASKLNISNRSTIPVIDDFPENLPEMSYIRTSLNRNNKYAHNTFSKTYLQNFVD